MASEAQLIDRIRRGLPSRPGPAHRVLLLGVGDDAALLRISSTRDWAVSTDAFLEGVHFLPEIHSPDAIGFKALARATSDLAAMGAHPRFFLLNLALPPSRTQKWLDGFLHGMSRAARRFGMLLAGGDTTISARVAVNLTVLGEAASGQAVRRSGASPGDLICVSGRLGEAALGLLLIRRRRNWPKNFSRLLARHLYPAPRIALGAWLAEKRLATAMIDISDGLSTDLGHLCEASGCGARIWRERIPVAHIPAARNRLPLDPLQLALHGGDDYELLFTISPRAARRLPRTFGRVPITVIGEITREKKILLIDSRGRASALRAAGWDPFRSR